MHQCEPQITHMKKKILSTSLSNRLKLYASIFFPPKMLPNVTTFVFKRDRWRTQEVLATDLERERSDS